jgi:hypothetical protein
MNELDLHPNGWNLWIVPRPFHHQLLTAAAHVAQSGPLTVLDCGRQYDSTIVARAARGRADVIDRIHIQRAFTCGEVARLIQSNSASQVPVLVLDILSTFQDENVSLHLRRFLLEQSIQHLQQLNRGAGLAVSVHPHSDSPETLFLLECLRSAATQVLTYELPVPTQFQPGLF